MGVLVKNENPAHSVSSAHRNTRLGMRSNGRVDGRISVVPIREAQREVAGRGPKARVARSGPGSAPRRRESSVEEESTRRVVD